MPALLGIKTTEEEMGVEGVRHWGTDFKCFTEASAAVSSSLGSHAGFATARVPGQPDPAGAKAKAQGRLLAPSGSEASSKSSGWPK